VEFLPKQGTKWFATPTFPKLPGSPLKLDDNASAPAQLQFATCSAKVPYEDMTLRHRAAAPQEWGVTNSGHR